MSRPLIGQVLRRMGKLTAMDIDEVLAEQAVSQRRFGQIAMSWGLCGADDLCDAWCSQLAEETTPIDPAELRPDPRALAHLPAALARSLGVLPLACMGDYLIVAASRRPDAADIVQIIRTSGHDVRFVITDPEPLRRAIELYYSLSQAA
jgi:hypothetical protein